MHQTLKRARLLPVAVGAFIGMALFTSGCGHATHVDPLLVTEWNPADNAVPPLLLEPGDAIQIKFQEATDMNDSQTIRPDGRISMPMVGEIMAAGNTPAQLTSILNEKFAAEMQSPKITVIVRSMAGRKIFVGGEVKNQGVYPLATPVSIYEAVLMAGGILDESAASKKVAVVRFSNEKRTIYLFDLHSAESIQSFYLQPRDLVFVPKKRIKKIDEWVTHYISDVIPKLQIPLYFDFPVGPKAGPGNSTTIIQ
jgi:protein involved in polysaccharide export with SLBB domain